MHLAGSLLQTRHIKGHRFLPYIAISSATTLKYARRRNMLVGLVKLALLPSFLCLWLMSRLVKGARTRVGEQSKGEGSDIYYANNNLLNCRTIVESQSYFSHLYGTSV